MAAGECNLISLIRRLWLVEPIRIECQWIPDS